MNITIKVGPLLNKAASAMKGFYDLIENSMLAVSEAGESLQSAVMQIVQSDEYQNFQDTLKDGQTRCNAAGKAAEASWKWVDKKPSKRGFKVKTKKASKKYKAATKKSPVTWGHQAS